MKINPLAFCSPFVLCLLPAVARADLEPFSFGASIVPKKKDDKLSWAEFMKLGVPMKKEVEEKSKKKGRK